MSNQTRIGTIEPDERLSARECQVLELIAQAFSVPAIATRLDLSDSTVKSHITRLYRHLGAVNRADLIVRAMRAGILTIETES